MANQVGQDGLGAPAGSLASREGINRVERKGKDDKGAYVPSLEGAGGAGQAVAGAGNAVVGGVVEGGKAAGGAVGGLLGGFGKGKGKE